METEIEILLVEDNESDAELTIRALKKSNLANRLHHAKDGQEALDFLFAEGSYANRKGLNTPQLILLDLKMPRISGLQVLERIKADKSTKNSIVIILTSSKEDPDVKACYELGANSYVVKPVQFDAFSKAISDLGMYWMILNQRPK